MVVVSVDSKDATRVVVKDALMVEKSGAIGVALMVAPTVEHWVAEMVVQTDASWAVCSVDVMVVPLAVEKDALLAVKWVASMVVTTA